MKQLINKIVWWFSGKCTICGTRKIEWRNADACPYHDLTPPKQPPQRIAEQQYNLLKLKQLQNHEAKNKNSNNSNRINQ